MKPTRAGGPDRHTFKLEDSLSYRLSVASSGVSRLMARRFNEEFGLSLPEWRVLVVVGRSEAISPTEVSEQTGMDKVKVSRAAATMVARGLLRQRPDPDDGRARVLSMSRKGQRLYENAIPLAQRLEDEITSVLNGTERTTLRRALGKLHDHLKQAVGPGRAALTE